MPPFVMGLAKDEQVLLVVEARRGAAADYGLEVVNLEEPAAVDNRFLGVVELAVIRAPPRPIPSLLPRVPPDVVDLESVLALPGAPSPAREADLRVAPSAAVGRSEPRRERAVEEQGVGYGETATPLFRTRRRCPIRTIARRGTSRSSH